MPKKHKKTPATPPHIATEGCNGAPQSHEKTTPGPPEGRGGVQIHYWTYFPKRVLVDILAKERGIATKHVCTYLRACDVYNTLIIQGDLYYPWPLDL